MGFISGVQLNVQGTDPKPPTSQVHYQEARFVSDIAAKLLGPSIEVGIVIAARGKQTSSHP